jgi:hypothetical protein
MCGTAGSSYKEAGAALKKIIHVNQHVLRKNTKLGTDEPVLTVKTYKNNDYAHEAVIRDTEGNEVARVVYRPHKPLPCGARCWIETNTESSKVELIVRKDNEEKS